MRMPQAAATESSMTIDLVLHSDLGLYPLPFSVLLRLTLRIHVAWYICCTCSSILSFVYYKFYFPLFQTHIYTLTYPKTKENKI